MSISNKEINNNMTELISVEKFIEHLKKRVNDKICRGNREPDVVWFGTTSKVFRLRVFCEHNEWNFSITEYYIARNEYIDARNVETHPFVSAGSVIESVWQCVRQIEGTLIADWKTMKCILPSRNVEQVIYDTIHSLIQKRCVGSGYIEDVINLLCATDIGVEQIMNIVLVGYAIVGLMPVAFDSDVAKRTLLMDIANHLSYIEKQL